MAGPYDLLKSDEVFSIEGETSLDYGDRSAGSEVNTYSIDQQRQTQRIAPIKYCIQPEFHLSEAANIYQPKDVNESSPGYQVRQTRAQSAFEPFYEHLRNLIVGTALRKGIAYDTEDSTWLKFFENVDLEGASLATFMKKGLTHALDGGVAAVWVEYPEVPEGATAGDEMRANFRPYLISIKCEDVLEVRDEVRSVDINGAVRYGRFPTYVRIRTTYQEVNPSNEFDYKRYNAVRVYDLVSAEANGETVERTRWRLYVEREEDKFDLVRTGFLSLPVIPFIPLYGGRIEGYFSARPQLLDIARLNMHHWVVASDLAFQIHNTSRDYLWGVGMTPDEEQAEFEADRMLTSQNPDAKFGMLSPEMKGAQASLDNLARIERSMERLAAVAMTTSKTQAESGFSKLLDRAQSDSQLAILVQELQDSLEVIIAYVGAYLQQPAPVVSISKDFIPVKLHSQQVMSYLQMWKETPMPIQLLLEMFRAGELYENILMEDGRPVTVDALLSQLGLEGTETARDLGYVAPAGLAGPSADSPGPDAGSGVEATEADPDEAIESEQEAMETSGM